MIQTPGTPYCGIEAPGGWSGWYTYPNIQGRCTNNYYPYICVDYPFNLKFDIKFVVYSQHISYIQKQYIIRYKT